MHPFNGGIEAAKSTLRTMNRRVRKESCRSIYVTIYFRGIGKILPKRSGNGDIAASTL